MEKCVFMVSGRLEFWTTNTHKDKQCLKEPSGFALRGQRKGRDPLKTVKSGGWVRASIS